MDSQLPTGSIVVGVDGTEQSRATVAWAVDLGRAVGRQVCVVNVWSVEMPAAAYGWVAPMTTAYGEEAAEAIVYDAVKDYAGDPNVVARTIRGEGWRSLVDATADAWLLVVGVHRGTWRHGLLGSFAHKTITHALCPTVVVPTHQVGVTLLEPVAAASAQ